MSVLINKLARFAAPLIIKKGQIENIKKGEFSGIKMRVHDPKEAMMFRLCAATWEQDHFKFIRRLKTSELLPKTDAVMCDIGANIGLYSYWLSSLFQGNCRIHAFEPLPEAIERLHDLLRLNEVKNVSVIEKALADKTGEVTFFRGRHHSSGSIVNDSGADSFSVETTSLDDYFLGSEPKTLPHFMKVDIEGGGVFALPGMMEVVRQASPLILIDSHNPEEDRAIGEFLKQLEWHAYRLNTGKFVTDLNKTHPSPNGVWGTMLLCSGKIVESVRSTVNGNHSVFT